jgi:hypothetical protein
LAQSAGDGAIPSLLAFVGGCLLGGEFGRELVDVQGVLMRLLGEFVSGSMICLAVRHGGGGVGVGGQVVELCESIVRAL